MLENFILSPQAYTRLWEGTQVTVLVFVFSTALGTALSLFFGVARLAPQRWVRTLASVYVEFARGVSAIILLFWMFFALPPLLGISLTPMGPGCWRWESTWAPTAPRWCGEVSRRSPKARPRPPSLST